MIAPMAGSIAWPGSWLWMLWHRYVEWRDRLPQDTLAKLHDWDREFERIKRDVSKLVA